MKLSKSQVRGFIGTLLGTHAVVVEDGDGDFLSPLVAAYLTGVLPEMPSEYGLNKAIEGKAGEAYRREADAFCDFLEAVVEQLRFIDPKKDWLPYAVKAGDPRTVVARFQYADAARNWAESAFPNATHEIIDEYADESKGDKQS